MEKFARKIENTFGEIKYQYLKDHITNVAENTEKFVNEFFCKNAGYILGLLHDLGKYSNEFQSRLMGINIKVDHSTAGAKVCHDIENDYKLSRKNEYVIFKAFKYAITGHHGGLLNHGINAEGTLNNRLEKDIPDFSDYLKELEINFDNIKLSENEIKFFRDNFSIQMLIRFFFSALVDSDRLDAQKFSEGENSVVNKTTLNLNEMLNIFNNFLVEIQKKSSNNPINSIRNKILNNCIDKSINKRGFYSLCVPTGGGKTISSLAFALNHAKHNKIKRIIYTLPFTSIIEQNAKVYADIFGEDNVLEHHCNFTFNNENEDSYSEKQLKYKLSTENWDMPLIITTTVQLFESMYSNKASNCRKLHNLYNSIIILDEAQVIPNEYLKPCMRALEELVKNYNCTVLFCTATQPEFSKNKLLSEEFSITEIINDTYKLFEDLKRVTAKFIGVQSVEEIKDKVNSYNQVLVIVNTKKHAKDIFSLLDDDDGNFHLSTNMYPNHRKSIIKEIRSRLKEGKTCRVISTQLIEAGVDVDFPVVFRSITGVDSIVQAAGRCNREGKLSSGNIYVFKPSDLSYLGLGYLKLTSQIGESIVKESTDILSIESISKYFYALYNHTNHRLDKQNILSTINKYKKHELNFDFQDIARDFKFINNEGTQIVISTEESNKLLNNLKKDPFSVKKTLRKLTGYSVNVPEHNFKELLKNNYLDEIIEGIFVLNNKNMYDFKLGFDKDRTEDYDYII